MTTEEIRRWAFDACLTHWKVWTEVVHARDAVDAPHRERPISMMEDIAAEADRLTAWVLTGEYPEQQVRHRTATGAVLR